MEFCKLKGDRVSISEKFRESNRSDREDCAVWRRKGRMDEELMNGDRSCLLCLKYCFYELHGYSPYADTYVGA